MKKTISDAVKMLDEICYEMEETYECGCFAHLSENPEEIVMDMSPQDHIIMFEQMQKNILKMRAKIDFLLAKT